MRFPADARHPIGAVRGLGGRCRGCGVLPFRGTSHHVSDAIVVTIAANTWHIPTVLAVDAAVVVVDVIVVAARGVAAAVVVYWQRGAAMWR